MYITFFGLRELPFPLANDSHFFYATSATQKAEESIVEALRNRTGMVLLTGEPGTGKTMLLRRIVSAVDSHASVIVLPFPAVTFDDILTYLCEQFSIVTSSDDPFARVLARFAVQWQQHLAAGERQGFGRHRPRYGAEHRRTRADPADGDREEDRRGDDH